MEDGGSTVRKTFQGGDAARQYELAAREFEHLRLFSEALSDLDGARCPRPLELGAGPEPYVRMECASGVPMQEHLNDEVWPVELHERVGQVLKQALVRYVDTFNEPYWDFIFRNMFYDPKRHVVTFLDFGIPTAYEPRLEELARYSAIESSLGALIASSIFETGMPKKMLQRRRHRQALVLIAAVLERFLDTSGDVDLRIEEVRRTARIAYGLTENEGGLARQGWYRSCGRVLARPSTKMNRLLAAAA
jgi:hypothetical protein